MRLNTNLNPWYVTGLTDSDGCFSVSISRSKTFKLGWSVFIVFTIIATNNPANMRMLEEVNAFFGNIGTIYTSERDNSVTLYIRGLTNCLIVRAHFLSYPLLTYKLVHFILWSNILDLMAKGEHLTLEGLLKIVAFKMHFRLGLSANLIEAFPNFIPITCPAYLPNLALLNIHWLCGFITGDGNFFINVVNSSKTLLGSTYRISINITQHAISLIVLEQIKLFLGMGYLTNSKNIHLFTISSISNINAFIKLVEDSNAKFGGSKELDYIDFCKSVKLISSKEHLTKSGLEQLKQIVDEIKSRRANSKSN